MRVPSLGARVPLSRTGRGGGYPRGAAKRRGGRGRLPPLIGKTFAAAAGGGLGRRRGVHEGHGGAGYLSRGCSHGRPASASVAALALAEAASSWS